MYTVQITEKKLESLRMLADWQIAEQGFDVTSINVALQKLDADKSAWSARCKGDRPCE